MTNKITKTIPAIEGDVLYQHCDVYWGSHGCELERHHGDEHVCDCCECGDHMKDHDKEGCVAKYPYYGEVTNFYGDDARPNEYEIMTRLKRLSTKGDNDE